jgi:hypothetical protein
MLLHRWGADLGHAATLTRFGRIEIQAWQMNLGDRLDAVTFEVDGVIYGAVQGNGRTTG